MPLLLSFLLECGFVWLTGRIILPFARVRPRTKGDTRQARLKTQFQSAPIMAAMSLPT